MVNLYTDKNLELKSSRNGLGVFAKRKYVSRENILEIKGHFITCDVDDDIDEETRSNAFRYNKNLFINAKGDFAFYLNHSCKPNSRIVKNKKSLYIFAVKDVCIGDEIVFDYSTVIGSDDIWIMDCNCGEDICRKRIKKFNNLPKIKKDEYKRDKIVPGYILKI